jgi:hypothetical protein
MRWLATVALLAGVAAAQNGTVGLYLGDGLNGTAVGDRITQLLLQTVPRLILGGQAACLSASVVCLALGDTSLAAEYISLANYSAAGPEGFVQVWTEIGGIPVGIADGNPVSSVMGGAWKRWGGARSVEGAPFLLGERAKETWAMSSAVVNLGAAHGAYAVLETLGFGFYHPLRPLLPTAASWRIPSPTGTELAISSPRWPVREWHVHTEHPLELTDVLQGFDASAAGNETLLRTDDGGYDYYESWDSMFWGVESLLEWLIANGQNTLEWVLLYDPTWPNDFGMSALRLSRLSNLTSTVHAWGLSASADAPIVERQQNGWFMSNGTDNMTQNVLELTASLSLLSSLGFDKLGTESGFSEFSNPGCPLMLALINATTAIAEHVGMRASIKCHCSTGQTCANYSDPRTGQPLDFNLLPFFADEAMGVLPHTVQAPSLFDDPALVYGNLNFTYIFEWIQLFAQQQPQREVVFHGETAYWVNLDSTTPLAQGLLYGERRMADLRYIAAMEQLQQWSMDGYNDFSSGWEYGYWLGDTIAARSAWSPPSPVVPQAGWTPTDVAVAVEASQSAALAALLTPILANLLLEGENSPSAASAAAATLAQQAVEQRAAWLFGNASLPHPLPPAPGSPSRGPDVSYTYRIALAYLNGWDTFADIQQDFAPSSTQPFKWAIDASFPADPDAPGPQGQPSVNDLLALLSGTAALADVHLAQLAAIAALAGNDGNGSPLLADLVLIQNVTALRAHQVSSLYASVWTGFSNASRLASLNDAIADTVAAAALLQSSAASFAVPWQRIASWRLNPTVYSFGYVWASRTAYYFWRDLAIAAYLVDPPATPDIDRLSPCYLNVISPVETGIGDGIIQDLAAFIRDIVDILQWIYGEAVLDCLAAPETEPQLPPPNVPTAPITPLHRRQ